MKKFYKMLLFILITISLLNFGGCSLLESDAVDMSERLITLSYASDYSDIAESVSPAIVGISCYNSSSESVGAGVCVASGGYILTNAHVVPYDNIEIYLFSGDTTSATKIFSDSSLDIAIIKSKISLPYLSLADNDSLAVGEEILAVGTPMSILLKHTFTKGIVSALNRTLRISSSSGESYMQNLIQHDASLNPGNSGGPLLNSKGEIVGINTLKITDGEGIGFAIPVKSFKSLLSSYVSQINYTTPYLGLYGLDSDIANYYDYTDETKGVYIVKLAENSPLKNAGVQEGDIVTKFNGLNINNYLDLRDELFKCNSDDLAEIEILHEGEYEQYNIYLQKHPVNNLKT